MPRVNVENRTVVAICYHFAHMPAFALDSSSLALAVRSKLPEAEIIHGNAVSEDKSEPCSWVRVGGKDYDVQLIAQRRRILKLGGAWPPDRVLAAECISDGECDNSCVDRYSLELENWRLPSCAACCGKKRAHTLDDGCIAPRKAEHIERRPKDWQDIKNRPLMFFKGTGSRCNYV